MGYFRDIYGTRSPDFIKGVLATMSAYAVWEDGTQTMGVQKVPLRKAMSEAVNDLAECPEDFVQIINNYC